MDNKDKIIKSLNKDYRELVKVCLELKKKNEALAQENIDLQNRLDYKFY